MRCRLKDWSVPDERSESGREFRILGAAAHNDQEPKIRLVWGTCKRLDEEDDLRTREGQLRNTKTRELKWSISLGLSLKYSEIIAGLHQISN